jgi:hypothetical protein
MGLLPVSGMAFDDLSKFVDRPVGRADGGRGFA